MENIMQLLNAPSLYMVAGVIILFIICFSLFFLVKSYRAGIAIGMDKTSLKRALTASATFTILPSISILLGVIALAGTLGIPLPWLRLSVIGALHYETTIADIAARSVGMSSLNATEMTPTAYATIALIMSVGIIWGLFITIFTLKKYLSMIAKKSKSAQKNTAETPDASKSPTAEKSASKKGLGDIMMAALFIGLISAYIGSYIGVLSFSGDYFPLVTLVFSGITMAIFEYCKTKFNLPWLENFSVAASMLLAMVGIVFVGILV